MSSCHHSPSATSTIPHQSQSSHSLALSQSTTITAYSGGCNASSNPNTIPKSAYLHQDNKVVIWKWKGDDSEQYHEYEDSNLSPIIEELKTNDNTQIGSARTITKISMDTAFDIDQLNDTFLVVKRFEITISDHAISEDIQDLSSNESESCDTPIANDESTELMKGMMLFYKTRKCPRYEQANCKYGDICFDSHSEFQRRPPVQLQQGIWNYHPHKMCILRATSYQKNCCGDYPKNCPKCHSDDEMNYHPLEYKTRPCTDERFKADGICSRGAQCWEWHHDQIDRRVPQNCVKIDYGNIEYTEPPKAYLEWADRKIENADDDYSPDISDMKTPDCGNPADVMQEIEEILDSYITRTPFDQGATAVPRAILEFREVIGSPGWITFDASKSTDIDGNSCASFLYEFGDDTTPFIISSPTISRPYTKPGIYKAKVTVSDLYGHQGVAFVSVHINDTQNIDPTKVLSKCIFNDRHFETSTARTPGPNNDLMNAFSSMNGDFVVNETTETPMEPVVASGKPGQYEMNLLSGSFSNQGILRPVINVSAHLHTEIVDIDHQLVKCDASSSHGAYGCYKFEFGDNTPYILSPSPIIYRPYPYYKAKKYGISVTVCGQNNQQRSALATIDMPGRKRPKKLQKKKKIKMGMEGRYNPPSSIRAIGNISIATKFTQMEIPSRVNLENISNLFSYMDKSTALQWNEDENKYDIDDMKALDYNFYDKKTGDKLYCVIKRQDETLKGSKNYKWVMETILYDKSQLKKLNIPPPQINRSWAKQIAVDTEINRHIADILQRTQLTKIKIYNKQNLGKGDLQKRWTIPVQKFREYCTNNTNWTAIVIVMGYENKVNICEYLSTIQTDGFDIGVSYKYDSSQKFITITGFHIDKSAIMEQHLLAMPPKHHLHCKCLNSWNDDPNITHLTIGDPNQHQIDKQRLEDEIKKTKEAMNCMVTVHNMNTAPTIPSNLVASNSNVYAPTSSINNTLQPRAMSVPILQQHMLSSNHGNHGHNIWCNSHQHFNQNNGNK